MSTVADGLRPRAAKVKVEATPAVVLEALRMVDWPAPSVSVPIVWVVADAELARKLKAPPLSVTGVVAPMRLPTTFPVLSSVKDAPLLTVKLLALVMAPLIPDRVRLPASTMTAPLKGLVPVGLLMSSCPGPILSRTPLPETTPGCRTVPEPTFRVKVPVPALVLAKVRVPPPVALSVEPAPAVRVPKAVRALGAVLIVEAVPGA